MKVGDYITCIKTGEMVDSDEVFAYKGKQYPITRITNPRRIEITSEVGTEHSWSLDDEDFNKHFTFKKNTWNGSTIKFNFI